MRKLSRVITVVVIGGGFVAAAAAFIYEHPTFLGQFKTNAQQLGHVFLFAALAWAAYYAGKTVTRLVFRRGRSCWEVDLAVGWFVFGAATFALAAAGLLYVWLVRAAVLALVALSAPTLWRVGRGVPDFVETRRPEFSPGLLLLVVAAVPFVAAATSCIGQPPFNWDVVVYHLYLPQRIIADHGFVYLPRLAYASMPLGAEMMFTWAYAWDGIGAAAAVAPLINFLLVVATWRLARRYLDNLWATAAAVIAFFTPTFAYLFNVAYTDFVLAAFALMALNVYLDGLSRRGEAALAGLLLGAALSVKYTGLHALFGFLPLVAWDFAKRRLSAKSAAVFLLTAFAVVLPWLAKAYVERGNPVFPAFYGVWGGRDLSAEAAAGIVRSMRAVGMGRGGLDYLLLPYRVSVMGDKGYPFFAGSLWPFSFLAVPLALVWFRRWRLILFTIFNFASWAVIGSQQLRFLGAAVATLAVLSAGVFAAGAGAFRGTARRAAAAVTVAAVVAFGYYLNLGHLINFEERFADYQREGADAFLAKWAPCYRANRFVNDNLPADSAVLLIFDNSRLYLEREAIGDAFCDASEIIYAVGKLESGADVSAFVASLGAAYIMTNKTAALYFWGYYPASTKRTWETYLNGYTAVIYDDGAYEVRAVTR
jgi:hypothetical protein